MVYKVLIILVYTLGYLLSLQVSDFFFEREKKISLFLLLEYTIYFP